MYPSSEKKHYLACELCFPGLQVQHKHALQRHIPQSVLYHFIYAQDLNKLPPINKLLIRTEMLCLKSAVM